MSFFACLKDLALYFHLNNLTLSPLRKSIAKKKRKLPGVSKPERSASIRINVELYKVFIAKVMDIPHNHSRKGSASQRTTAHTNLQSTMLNVADIRLHTCYHTRLF